MRQSGCAIPEWMLQLKNPSKKAKKSLRRKPVERQDVSVAAGSNAKRKGSKKRKETAEASKKGKGGKDSLGGEGAAESDGQE
jgi:ATP-dependent RNA helicase DDX52/ROK1